VGNPTLPMVREAALQWLREARRKDMMQALVKGNITRSQQDLRPHMALMASGA